eukprot:1962613-Rhodomonas_salina.2
MMCNQRGERRLEGACSLGSPGGSHERVEIVKAQCERKNGEWVGGDADLTPGSMRSAPLPQRNLETGCATTRNGKQSGDSHSPMTVGKMPPRPSSTRMGTSPAKYTWTCYSQPNVRAENGTASDGFDLGAAPRHLLENDVCLVREELQYALFRHTETVEGIRFQLLQGLIHGMHESGCT